ncbi:MAG: tetratricopeptide repeat protein [Candidatus Levybacteria bacterium]|nr:tetratricopeptide repeat protein [Candidatus Levybacteria bacterium]
MTKQDKIILYIENLSVLLLGLFILIFPFAATDWTTEMFVLPKQIILAFVVLFLTVLFGVKTLISKEIIFKKTPFDIPIILFIFSVFLSSIFSLNKYDSLIAFVPLFLSVLFYFLTVNSAKSESHSLFLISCFIVGSCVISIVAVFSIIPLGSLLDQAIYIVSALAIAGYIVKKEDFHAKGKLAFFAIASIIITIGLTVTVYKIIVINSTFILPFNVGFQTALAAISQGTDRIIQNFLFGSGFGTYQVDFTKFKQVSFNLNPKLWSLTFTNSSSFLLELLSTTGFLGFSTFVFLIYKIFKQIKPYLRNSALFSLILIAVLSFILPFSFVSYTIFFILLGFVVSETKAQEEKKGGFNSALLIFIFSILFAGFTGFFVSKYIISDFLFKSSFWAASSNDSKKTYLLEEKAIQIFPYRDYYYRIYSQTNLALAKTMFSMQNPSIKEDSLKTVYSLIQKSIISAKKATSISPQTALNWQNLSSIYRSLIGFGQNADGFAIASQKQAIIQDPNNPKSFLFLGGIYYQLNQYDNAQKQFQIAVTLKPDLANSHYNLGHAYESKGDLQNALEEYLIVNALVENNLIDSQKISKEIEILKKAIETSKQPESLQKEIKPILVDEPQLNIDTSSQLPKQKIPVQIPAP